MERGRSRGHLQEALAIFTGPSAGQYSVYELRWRSLRRCLQTKSGSNVSTSLWIRLIDFRLFFYDLCREMSHQIMFFADVLPLLVSLEDVYSFKI